MKTIEEQYAEQDKVMADRKAKMELASVTCPRYKVGDKVVPMFAFLEDKDAYMVVESVKDVPDSLIIPQIITIVGIEFPHPLFHTDFIPYNEN